MRATSTITVSRPRPGVMMIRLSRPERLNALSRTLLAELATTLEQAADDDDVRCVVLTGNERAFSAGADLKEMLDDPLPPFAQALRLCSWKTIERFAKPLVAAVEGYALGGGCELALLCDILIAGENARFGTPEIKVGMFPGDGGTQRLPRTMGKARAMMMVLTGDPIDARTAHEWGLSAEVVPVGQTIERATEIAARIAEMPPLAARLAKEDVLTAYEKPLDESLSLERKMLLWQSEDCREGIRAFVEKRTPRFRGR